MSTLKVNNIEPTSGNTLIINADTQIVSSTGNVIDLGGATNDFSGSLTVTGSISNKDGDVIINDGNLIIKSGSLEITGSGETVSIIGNSDFQGNIIISGCLDIACYNDDENPIFWALDGRTTPAPNGFEYVSINYSTYGNLTTGIAAAAAASNNICYIYDPATGVYAPYGYAGTVFDSTNPPGVTYISASGPDIPTGTIVQIGFPFPVSGATPIYPIGTGSVTPIASFCCDGITLNSDVTISGGLDVYGTTTLHDGLIVTGCIEMYCPGDEATAWYGYKGSVRFSKSSASAYLNYAWLDSSYGDVRTAVSASAAANSGTLQLYNTVTGTTQTVTYIGSTWTQTITIVEYSTPTLTAFNPMPVIHIGNQNPNLQPSGADVLMGSGSSTPTQTAIFCCDGNTLFGDTTFTGSVTITGSTSTSGSVVITGPTEVTGSVNIKGDGKVNGNFGVKSGSFDVSGSVIVSGSFTNTGSFNNTGSIVNTGSINNSGSIVNTGSFNNTGSITNAGGFINTGSIVNSGSFTNVGNITVSGSFEVSGGFALPKVLDGPPAYTGKKGEMVFSVNADNYFFYVYLNGAWRSGSLA